MGVNGKQKGARAERELCKLFSTWWGVPNSWGRSPMSGAFATVGKKSGLKVTSMEADLISPEGCILAVESKKQEGWNLAHLFSPLDAKKPVSQWWAQAVRQASAGKVPMLVFGKNMLLGAGHPPWLVMLPARANMFGSGNVTEYDCVFRTTVLHPSSGYPLEPVLVAPLTTFFSCFTPADFTVKEPT